MFENKLKKETQGAIKTLIEAQISVVIITGDNPLTGSNIGFKSGVIDPYKNIMISYVKRHSIYQNLHCNTKRASLLQILKRKYRRFVYRSLGIIEPMLFSELIPLLRR